MNVIRPLNVLLAGATVWLGAWLTAVPLLAPRTWVATLVVMLYTAAGNVMNDVYDLAVDRLNRPERALPSGRITSGQARLLYRLLFGAGTLLALYQGLYWIAVPALALIVWYNRRLQHTPLAGNLVVALLTVLPLWYAACLSAYHALLFPSLLIFLVQLAREIVKDIEDCAGDRLRDARTLPLLIGERRALLAAAGLNLLLWLVALLAWYREYYTVLLPLVVLLVILPLTLWGFLQAGRQGAWRRLQMSLKLVMIIGFVTLIFGVR